MRVPTEVEMMEVNLGIVKKQHHVFVSKNLHNEELVAYVAFLREYKDVLAWTYAEMPRLDSSIAIHCLNIKLNVKLHQQS